MSCNCSRKEISALVVDSAVFYGLFSVREPLMRLLSQREIFDASERMVRTGVFALASLTWENYLYQPLYDIFEKAGKAVENPVMGCGSCIGRNLYIIFIQFLVDWYRLGLPSMSAGLWDVVGSFLQLLGTDMIGGWVKTALKKNNLLMSSVRVPGDINSYSVESRGGKIIY